MSTLVLIPVRAMDVVTNKYAVDVASYALDKLSILYHVSKLSGLRTHATASPEAESEVI